MNIPASGLGGSLFLLLGVFFLQTLACLSPVPLDIFSPTSHFAFLLHRGHME